MALSGKYIQIGEILERVYRDYGFEDDLDWNDAIVWVADALDLIGAPRAYTPKVTDGSTSLGNPDPICIKNHRGDLPCDLHLIVQAREWNTKIPMIWNSDSFHSGIHVTEAQQTKINCVDTKTCVVKEVDTVPSTDVDDNTHCNPFFNFNPNPTSNTAFGANVPTSQHVDYQKELSYTLNGNKIFTSFKEGMVELAYWAFPTDEDGLPLVPAETRFQEAIKNYLAHRISFKLSIQGKIQPGIADRLEQEWLFYCASAGLMARIPSIDQMESLKNQWLRTIPEIDEHDKGFRYLNQPERRNNYNAR
jgi:hypothetical protein